MVLPALTVLSPRYAVRRPLGEPGPFSITYLGWDIETEAQVILQEYLPSGLARRADDAPEVVVNEDEQQAALFQTGLKYFLKEAMVLSEVEHPHVTPVRAPFKALGTAYRVWEHQPGMALASAIEKKGALSERAALTIVDATLDALETTHSRGLLHGGVSPGTIHLMKDGRALLHNFRSAFIQLARRGDRLDAAVRAGTSAPEQYAAEGKQGPWTDVYACAATVCHIVTGGPIPAAPDRLDTDPLADRLEAETRLTPAVRAVLLDALTLDPRSRTRSAQAFREQLQEALAAPPARPSLTKVETPPPEESVPDEAVSAPEAAPSSEASEEAIDASTAPAEHDTPDDETQPPPDAADETDTDDETPPVADAAPGAEEAAPEEATPAAHGETHEDATDEADETSSTEDAPGAPAPSEEKLAEEAPHDAFAAEQSPQDHTAAAPPDEAPSDEAPSDEAPSDEAPPETAADESATDEPEDAKETLESILSGAAAPSDTETADKATTPEPAAPVSNEEPPDPEAEDVPAITEEAEKKTPAEEAPVEEAPAEDVSAEEAPDEELPAQETPAEEQIPASEAAEPATDRAPEAAGAPANAEAEALPEASTEPDEDTEGLPEAEAPEQAEAPVAPTREEPTTERTDRPPVPASEAEDDAKTQLAEARRRRLMTRIGIPLFMLVVAIAVLVAWSPWQSAQSASPYTALRAYGDSLFARADYAGAKSFYTQALDVRPNDPYISERLQEVEAVQGEALQEQYDRQIDLGDALAVKADSLLSEEDLPGAVAAFEEAKEAYRAAYDVRPDDPVITDRIQEVDSLLVSVREVNEEQQTSERMYTLFRKQGDEQFASGNYRVAERKYREALDYRPEDEYLQEQIDAVDRLLAEREAEQQYAALAADADSLFQAGRYSEARVLYNRALEVRPQDSLATAQLAAIDDVLAQQNERERQFQYHRGRGDGHFELGEYEAAIQSYRQALNYRPNDSYVTNRIEASEDALAEQQREAERQRQAIQAQAEALRQQRVQEDGIYTAADTEPQLIGGLAGLHREVQYPPEALNAGVEGRVYLEVVVNADGSVRSARVTKGIGSGCDQEALRVVRQAAFEPARLDGEAVPYRHALWVQFKIEQQQRQPEER